MTDQRTCTITRQEADRVAQMWSRSPATCDALLSEYLNGLADSWQEGRRLVAIAALFTQADEVEREHAGKRDDFSARCK